jgi:hypothetical protein
MKIGRPFHEPSRRVPPAAPVARRAGSASDGPARREPFPRPPHDDSSPTPNSYRTLNYYADRYLHLLTPDAWKVLSYVARRVSGFEARQGRALLLKNDLEWNTTLKEMGASAERSPNVINREADDALAALGDDDAREAARRVLVSLVQVVPRRRGQDALRQVPLSEFDKPARPVVKSLVRARLLSSARDESTGEEVVAFAQEATLRHWEKLKGWLDEKREFLVWRQQLRTSMAVWEDNGKQPGDLLTGAALSTAEDFLATYADELSASDKEYITASAAEVGRRKRARHLGGRPRRRRAVRRVPRLQVLPAGAAGRKASSASGAASAGRPRDGAGSQT